jgi:hypothetical protein
MSPQQERQKRQRKGIKWRDRGRKRRGQGRAQWDDRERREGERREKRLS